MTTGGRERGAVAWSCPRASRSYPGPGAAGFETGEPTAAGTRAERSGGSRMAETVGAVALIVAPARRRCLWSVLAAMLGLCECCGAGPGPGGGLRGRARARGAAEGRGRGLRAPGLGLAARGARPGGEQPLSLDP